MRAQNNEVVGAPKQHVLKVATHSGPYHSDDIFAIAILQLVKGDFEVIRTRDEQVMNTCDMRVDVGGAYNPETGDFDHHQKEGAGERENGIPYASCGLVWKDFGRELCGEEVWQKIDESIIQFIDAEDNGIDTFTVEKVPPYTIQAVFGSFRPAWNEEQDFDSAFMKCVELAKTLLINTIRNAQAKLLAKEKVREKIEEFKDKGYVVLDQYMPWKSTLTEESDVLYCIFPNSTGTWMSEGVPKEKGSFEKRKLFPSAWAGLRDEDLVTVSGVADLTFCHRTPFIIGSKTKEGIIKAVELALQN